MFFKVAVVSLLGYLALLATPVPVPLATRADVPAPVAASALPPPAPVVVVVPAAASSTRVVDVRRADLERALTVAQSARIIPTLRHGQPLGVKLYAIRPGSPLAAIGLENGDTLLAINDVALTTPDRALEIYRTQRNPDHYDLDLERRGERVRILVLVH